MATSTAKKSEPSKQTLMDRQAWKRVGAYIILAASVLLAFAVQSNDRTQGRRQVCQAILGQRQLLADILGNTQSSVRSPIDPTLSPEIIEILEEARVSQQNFLNEAQELLIEPVAICESVGIPSSVIIRDSEGRELAPLPDPSTVVPTTATPTTMAVTEEASSTAPTTGRSTTGSTTTSASPTTVVVVVPGPAGPPGPQGPPGTVVESTTTTTTGEPGLVRDLFCMVLGVSCQ